MSTKLQKQIKESTQVRVHLEWHKRLKVEAAQRGIMIVELVEEMCANYFNGRPLSSEQPLETEG